MIYVETLIDAPLASVWERTQNPRAHQRWDLRFTSIEYLPREPGEPQRFRYAFGLGPRLELTGVGSSTGDRHLSDGTAVSALRFRADQRLSPLRSGAGYWKYVPTEAGVRFLTGYRYDGPRWSRPLLGWATAWSFDRLRLWLETGRSPRLLLWRALGEWATRGAAVGLAAWLVPVGPAAVIAALTALAALLLPPLPGTPAARRCRRRPATGTDATEPSTLNTLERP